MRKADYTNTSGGEGVELPICEKVIHEQSLESNVEKEILNYALWGLLGLGLLMVWGQILLFLICGLQEIMMKVDLTSEANSCFNFSSDTALQLMRYTNVYMIYIL